VAIEEAPCSGAGTLPDYLRGYSRPLDPVGRRRYGTTHDLPPSVRTHATLDGQIRHDRVNAEMTGQLGGLAVESGAPVIEGLGQTRFFVRLQTLDVVDEVVLVERDESICEHRDRLLSRWRFGPPVEGSGNESGPGRLWLS